MGGLTMATKKDLIIGKICQQALNGVAINIMVIGKVFDHAKREYDAGKRDEALNESIREFAKTL